MIEKLERYIREEDGVKISCPPDNVHIIRKINELVDAVNVLQAQVAILEEHAHPTAKTEVKEMFVCPEQYKWVGKLCKFWDYADKPVYGILDDVDVDKIEYPYTKLGGCIYQNCEPVKPDDDIIYKGGNNE